MMCDLKGHSCFLGYYNVQPGIGPICRTTETSKPFVEAGSAECLVCVLSDYFLWGNYGSLGVNGWQGDLVSFAD